MYSLKVLRYHSPGATLGHTKTPGTARKTRRAGGYLHKA